MFLALAGSISFSLHAQNTSDTRLMHSPAVSARHLAFIYAEDLWVANLDGSNPRRLTVDGGVESNPVFSPDGSLIAFSAQYDGNTDAFVVPASGGIPKRLTWHPSQDIVRDFTPDGNAVLFNSHRTNHTRAHYKLYTVSIAGGQPRELPIPVAFRASYSDDGNHIAYNPNHEVFNQWKHYRGGTQARIWIYDTATHAVKEVPRPMAGGNDANPKWMGGHIYFRSDREGEFNLYAYNTSDGSIRQLTHFTDFPVLGLSADAGHIVFEQAGYLHQLDPDTGEHRKITIGIAADLLEMRPRYVSGSDYIRNAHPSPSGARVVMDFRGDIVTVPAEKGDVAYLTQTAGVHENSPAWSPDGKTIAYFSDAPGEYVLHLFKTADRSTTFIPLPGTGFYAYPHWSPDSKHLAFVDNGRNLYVLTLSSGQIRKIDADRLYVPGAFRDLFGSWSHDSNWIAYTVITETNFEQAYVFSLSENKTHPLSDGLSNVSEPVFDPSGKYLYMFASTDAGPVVNWFDQSNNDMEMTQSVYLVTLQKDLTSPLARENDEETPVEAEAPADKPGDKKKEKDGKEQALPLRIDWDNITNRIVSLPVPPGMYSQLAASEEGKIWYLSGKPHSDYDAPRSLMSFTLEEREAKEILQANMYEITADGKKMLFRKGSDWGIAELGKAPDNGILNTGAVEVKIDPAAEWPNIFEEAWRVNRDYFYDPGMHGADWPGMREKYRVFLPDVVCRSDLYRVIQWMCSELAVGHHFILSEGDRLHEAKRIGVGLLGADYDVSGNRYRFRKIYGGLNWSPDLRAPLTEPGILVKEGDFLLEVDGAPVTADQNLYQFFENKAGKIVHLTVGSAPDDKNPRTYEVVPVASENALRNRDWIEANIRKVDAATDGQVAYVYVPNTTTEGHEYFKRYFYPQVDKKAVIIDERYNGGGQLADYYIDILKKPYQSYWNFRHGKDLKAPSGSIQGPKVMLIDENAGSGGDYLPWMFRKFGLGPLIGKTTWGGLVGILGYPEFIDGGMVTAPNVAFWNEEGYGIENVGIAPDIDVEQWPVEVIEGHDPQLEKAIEVILEELKRNPPAIPKRPEYPVRVQNR